jgi:hypothetical protein
MLADLRKSVAAVLYERTASPFYGTLIISWLLINWKIPYLTFFVDWENQPYISKIQYIEQHYSNPWLIYFAPLGSTFFLVLLMPYVSNWAYELSIRFKKERIDKKNEIEGKTMISAEKYTQLIEDIARKDKTYQANLDNSIQESNVWKTQADSHVQDKIRFKVVSAIYGRKTMRFKDVTELLNKAIVNDSLDFAVANDQLDSITIETDPTYGHWKELFVCYQYNGKVSTFGAVEGDKFSIINGVSVVHPSSISRRIDQAIEQEQHRDPNEPPTAIR